MKVLSNEKINLEKRNKHVCIGYNLKNCVFDICYEEDNGSLCVEINGDEYNSLTNFCPLCGYEAKTKIDMGVKEDE